MNSRNDDYGLISLGSVSTLLFGYSSAITMNRTHNSSIFNDFFAKMEVLKNRKRYLDLELFLKWYKKNLKGDYLIKYSDYLKAIDLEILPSNQSFVVRELKRYGRYYFKLSDLNKTFKKDLKLKDVLKKCSENKGKKND